MLAASAMSRFRSLLSLLLLPGLLAATVAARAADLGPILLTSPAGEPLQGLVSMALAGEESADDLNVAIGSPAEYGWLEIARPSWVDDVEVHVASEEEGGPKVRIWTAEPPPDRQFSLLLVVSSPTGRSLRQYDVVLRDAEVLLAPAEPQAPTAADEQAKRYAGTSGADADQGAASLPVIRPSRRAMQVPDRGEPQVRRNLSISSAGTRLNDSALEKRAQRLEESAAAQQRALKEANARITELQGQLEKLERLLALKGVVVETGKAEPAKPAEAGKTPDAVAKPGATVEKPADAAHGAKPSADAATAAPAGAVSAEGAAAQPPQAPASAAAPMEEVEPAAEAPPEEAAAEPAADSHDKAPAEGDVAAHGAEDADHDDGVTGLLLMVGGVVLVLLLATLGAFWWRRRRARQAELAAALAAAAGAAVSDAAVEAAGPAAVEETAAPEAATEAAAPPAESASAPAEAAAAIGAVDEQIAAALDEPIGDAAPVEVAAPADSPVASLDAVTAEPPADVAADDLDAMFSEEAIAQAAIPGAAGAAPAPAAEGEATPAEPGPVVAAVGEATAVSAGEMPAVETGDEEDEADNAADLEDVEVNLAKAYIDMGDPDGARAILESMMSDPDDPDRAALARRTMRRFGLRRSAPPAEGAPAEG